MPAVSQAQQKAMAIAEHEPDKLYSRNKNLLSMSKSSLHDFASTSTKHLPNYKKKKKSGLQNLPDSSDTAMKDTSSMDKY